MGTEGGGPQVAAPRYLTEGTPSLSDLLFPATRCHLQSGSHCRQPNSWCYLPFRALPPHTLIARPGHSLPSFAFQESRFKRKVCGAVYSGLKNDTQSCRARLHQHSVRQRSLLGSSREHLRSHTAPALQKLTGNKETQSSRIQQRRKTLQTQAAVPFPAETALTCAAPAHLFCWLFTLKISLWPFYKVLPRSCTALSF